MDVIYRRFETTFLAKSPQYVTRVSVTGHASLLARSLPVRQVLPRGSMLPERSEPWYFLTSKGDAPVSGTAFGGIVAYNWRGRRGVQQCAPMRSKVEVRWKRTADHVARAALEEQTLQASRRVDRSEVRP
jgi:hypothetical protein